MASLMEKKEHAEAKQDAPQPYPFFYYKDFSREKDPDPTQTLNTSKGHSFPWKMHMILSDPDFEHIVAWVHHGRSWRILRPREFESKVIPAYFEHSKFSSFIRQANGWGFRRVIQGRDRGSYYHERFLRNLPHLCKQMKRPGKAMKLVIDSDNEPDLYKISQMHPVPEAESSAKVSDDENTSEESSVEGVMMKQERVSESQDQRRVAAEALANLPSLTSPSSARQIMPVKPVAPQSCFSTGANAVSQSDELFLNTLRACNSQMHANAANLQTSLGGGAHRSAGGNLPSPFDLPMALAAASRNANPPSLNQQRELLGLLLASHAQLPAPVDTSAASLRIAALSALENRLAENARIRRVIESLGLAGNQDRIAFS